MDALNSYGLFVGIVFGVLSAGATFFNKQRFEATITLLQTGNDELRGQNKDLRDKATERVAEVAALEARNQEKDRLIENLKRQPNLKSLTQIITNNHTEVMTAILGEPYNAKQ